MVGISMFGVVFTKMNEYFLAMGARWSVVAMGQ